MTPGFAMLCDKAWRESRARFALSVVVLGGLCAGLILFHAMFRARLRALGGDDAGFDAYVYARIYGGLARAVFVVLVVVLGLGGLQRERAARTIGFSLALPVRRRDHVAAHAAVGLVEVAALALLPALLVPACAAAVGERVELAQALGFAALWLAIGAVMFAASVAISAVVRGDYAAMILALVALRVVPMALARVPVDGPWQLDRVMNGRGMPYFDAATLRLIGLPGWIVLGAAAFTAALLAIAMRALARERFFE